MSTAPHGGAERTRLDDYVAEVVAAAPPLTEQQRSNLTRLLSAAELDAPQADREAGERDAS